jgi:hypothetical protein
MQAAVGITTLALASVFTMKWIFRTQQAAIGAVANLPADIATDGTTLNAPFPRDLHGADAASGLFTGTGMQVVTGFAIAIAVTAAMIFIRSRGRRST